MSAIATRTTLQDGLVVQIRQFIAGTILFNQRVADRAGLHLTDVQCINLLELLGPSTPGTLAQCTGLTTGGVTAHALTGWRKRATSNAPPQSHRPPQHPGQRQSEKAQGDSCTV